MLCEELNSLGRTSRLRVNPATARVELLTAFSACQQAELTAGARVMETLAANKAAAPAIVSAVLLDEFEDEGGDTVLVTPPFGGLGAWRVPELAPDPEHADEPPPPPPEQMQLRLTTLKGLLGELGAPAAPAHALRMARELLGGLAALHGAGVIHTDLCSERVFVSARGALELGWMDLALHRAPKAGKRRRDSGSFAFMSPARMSTGACDRVKDNCWSAGLVLLQACTGTLNDFALLDAAEAGDFGVVPAGPLRRVVGGLLTATESERLTAAEALAALSEDHSEENENAKALFSPTKFTPLPPRAPLAPLNGPLSPLTPPLVCADTPAHLRPQQEPQLPGPTLAEASRDEVAAAARLAAAASAAQLRVWADELETALAAVREHLPAADAALAAPVGRKVPKQHRWPAVEAADPERAVAAALRDALQHAERMREAGAVLASVGVSSSGGVSSGGVSSGGGASALDAALAEAALSPLLSPAVGGVAPVAAAAASPAMEMLSPAVGGVAPVAAASASPAMEMLSPALGGVSASPAAADVQQEEEKPAKRSRRSSRRSSRRATAEPAKRSRWNSRRGAKAEPEAEAEAEPEPEPEAEAEPQQEPEPAKKKAKRVKQCPDCAKQYPARKRKCECGGKLEYAE